MLIHFGTYRFGKKLVACRNAYCVSCGSQVFSEGYRSILVFHFFFIPILPYGRSVKWVCTECQNEIGSGRPSRPPILVAGAIAGLALVFIGAMIVLQEGDPAGYWVSLVGLLMIIGLLVLLFTQRSKYDYYIESCEAVIPLDSKICPYCHGVLLARPRPRCFSCEIDVIS